MKLSHSIKISISFLVSINLLIAFGAIWLFMRIAPAIDLIVKNNVSSLESCQGMLASLIPTENESIAKKNFRIFEYNLKKAKDNALKNSERVRVNTIRRNYKKAFDNDIESRSHIMLAIDQLARINKDAIFKLEKKAMQLSKTGAWGIVFMAGMMFLLSMLLLQRLNKKFLYPVEEIYDVMKACKNNDNLRRCTGVNMNEDMKLIFDETNKLLDERIKYE